MRCPECRSSDVSTVMRVHHYVECGLPNVFIRTPFLVCSACGASTLTIPALSGLHATIARAVASQRETLTPEEFRFLRKQLRFSALQLAAIIDKTPETISRWENGRSTMPRSVELLLRMSVLNDPALNDASGVAPATDFMTLRQVQLRLAAAADLPSRREFAFKDGAARSTPTTWVPQQLAG